MTYLKTLALCLALNSGGVWADCISPDTPDVPDGAKASYDDMIAAQKAVKEFQTANMQYRSCVEKDIAAAEAVATDDEASDEDKAAALTRRGKAVDTYNAAVKREEDLAGQFNSEIQKYQSANAE